MELAKGPAVIVNGIADWKGKKRPKCGNSRQQSLGNQFSFCKLPYSYNGQLLSLQG